MWMIIPQHPRGHPSVLFILGICGMYKVVVIGIQVEFFYVEIWSTFHYYQTSVTLLSNISHFIIKHQSGHHHMTDLYNEECPL